MPGMTGSTVAPWGALDPLDGDSDDGGVQDGQEVLQDGTDPMDPGDDMWRYRWDGMVQNAGFNPYALAPEADELRGLRGEVWRNVQHQSVTSIYPPITQLGFRLIEATGLPARASVIR